MQTTKFKLQTTNYKLKIYSFFEVRRLKTEVLNYKFQITNYKYMPCFEVLYHFRIHTSEVLRLRQAILLHLRQQFQEELRS
jgi:hypothetical protein